MSEEEILEEIQKSFWVLKERLDGLFDQTQRDIFKLQKRIEEAKSGK